MGEDQMQALHLSFNASLKIDFQGSRVTSDTGLILVRSWTNVWDSVKSPAMLDVETLRKGARWLVLGHWKHAGLIIGLQPL